MDIPTEKECKEAEKRIPELANELIALCCKFRVECFVAYTDGSGGDGMMTSENENVKKYIEKALYGGQVN
jgi:hypothetical protein